AARTNEAREAARPSRTRRADQAAKRLRFLERTLGLDDDVRIASIPYRRCDFLERCGAVGARSAERTEASEHDGPSRNDVPGRIDGKDDLRLLRLNRCVLVLPEATRLPDDRGRVALKALEELREAIARELARRDVRWRGNHEEPRFEHPGGGK